MKTQHSSLAEEQREYEQGLSRIVEERTRESPNDPLVWTTARNMSGDWLMRNYYLNKMMACIQNSGEALSYLKGIVYVRDIGRDDLREKLQKEMIQRYPIKGRFNLLLLSFIP